MDKIVTEEDQHEWECQFESTFIAPVLNVSMNYSFPLLSPLSASLGVSDRIFLKE